MNKDQVLESVGCPLLMGDRWITRMGAEVVTEE
jgi:hypothetical protein